MKITCKFWQNFRELKGLFCRLEKRVSGPYFLELLSNIASALAAIKLCIAGTHHADRRLRPFARGLINSRRINIIADTMYHGAPLSQMRMIVNCLDNDSQLQGLLSISNRGLCANIAFTAAGSR